MKKTTKKTKKTAKNSIPFELATIGWLLGGNSDDMREALQAARVALEKFANDPTTGSRHDVMTEFESYIETYANNHSEHMDRVREVHADVEGDLFCSIGGPGLLAGAALAWLMLRGDVQTGGAR